MKAIKATGSPLSPHLSVTEAPIPKAGAGDVVIKVKAASVNPKDFKLNFNLARPSTLIPNLAPPLFGDDLAGVVVEVGRGVADYKVGDEVYGMDMRLRTASLAEYARIATKRIAPKPASLTFEEAASVPLAALTALQGLRKGNAKTDSQVLLIGASGGVGTFAVQIAKAMGCEVTAVCGQFNVQRVKDLGADTVVNRHETDYRQLDKQFDLVFDITSFETPKNCERILKLSGYFISTAGQTTAYLGMLKRPNPRHQFIFVESYTNDLLQLNEWIDQGLVRPVIAKTYSMEEADLAYAFSRTGKANGKIVLTWA